MNNLCPIGYTPLLYITACGLFVLFTRYIALAIMKLILVCERPAVEPFLPDMVRTKCSGIARRSKSLQNMLCCVLRTSARSCR